MQINELSKQFYELVAPSLPNEWDVEDSLQSLVDLHEETTQAILQQVPVIWPVSHSLCFTYLSHVVEAIPHLSTENLDIWVGELLDQYEKGGLHAVQVFMQDTRSFLPRLQGKKGLRLEDIRPRLQPYVNGLAGKEMPLLASATTYTDTESLFIPAELDILTESTDAFLLYKCIITFQWASVKIGTLGTLGFGPTLVTGNRHPLQNFFAAGKDPLQRMQLYHFFETLRILAFLRCELPGLMKDFSTIAPKLQDLFRQQDKGESEGGEDTCDLIILLQEQLFSHFPQSGEKGVSAQEASLALIEALEQSKLDRSMAEQLQKRLGYWWDKCAHPKAVQKTSREAALDIAACINTMDIERPFSYEADPLIFQGSLRLVEVMTTVRRQRALQQQRFIDSFSSHLADSQDLAIMGDAMEEDAQPRSSQMDDDAAAAIIKQAKKKNAEQGGSNDPLIIMVDNNEVELSEELSELVEEIVADLGKLPAHYVSAAAGKAGKTQAMPTMVPEEEQGEAQGKFTYDEWDYRRKGFRKNWCALTEKPINTVHSRFVDDTLRQYRHQIALLKKQFEMLQTSDRFARRRREGDDIDFDALVESMTDTVAGLPPSDRLFIRLLRDERDIAVLFLVDMSNSTEGWVGKAIKEALILIAEAMEKLNDQYGIYGFSGMRRLRCEVFPVKTLDEKYSPAIRQRIAGISPKEYTRIAPAIRHMTSIFSTVEAKLRLLIILSDGKPEDYDGYKGEYAIEDTRHALFEAKAAGIHPFCITIDKEAPSYMEYMYGPANSIFVDNVNRLPVLMPEIYRVLTT